MKTTKVLAALALFALIAIHKAHAATNYVLDVRSSADYVSIPDSDSLDLISTSFTLEAWINAAVFTSTDGTIIGKRRLDGGSSYHLSVSRFGGNSTLQKAKVVVGMNNGDGLNVVNYALFTAQEIETNVWYHIAATYDRGSDTARVYINGELKALERVVLAVPLQNSSFPVTIGQLNLKGEPRPFLGLIGEVRVWNRALIKAEIQQNMSLRLTGQEPGLVGYWNFDDQTAKDSSIYHNDGAFVGGAQTVEDPLVLLQIYRAVEILSLSGSASATYQVQFKTNASSSTWINLDQPFPGGQPVQFFDITRDSGQKIYRVIRIR